MLSQILWGPRNRLICWQRWKSRDWCVVKWIGLEKAMANVFYCQMISLPNWRLVLQLCWECLSLFELQLYFYKSSCFYPFPGPSAVELTVSDCTIVQHMGDWLFGACLLWPGLVPANVLEVPFHDAILFRQFKNPRDYNYQRREALWNVELFDLKDCQAFIVL